MTPSGDSHPTMEVGKQENGSSNSVPPSTISIMQAWERREDIQSTQPHVDVTDAWSSDGGSVSSSSCCSSDQLVSGQDEVNHDTELVIHDQQPLSSNQNDKYRTGASCLKHARIFTSEEAINQAIDRWQAYIRLCTRALGRLRHQLVDAYIPFALEQHRLNRTTKHNAIKSEEHIQSTEAGRSCGQRQRALRNMLRHSVKVANQRHQSCVSKFALVSNRLAKWRKPASSVRCRYRDPTTTTWEKICTNQCLPLLQVCVHHLVQLNPAPETLPAEGAGSLTAQKKDSASAETLTSTAQSDVPDSGLSVPRTESNKKTVKSDETAPTTPVQRTGCKKLPAGRTVRAAESSTGVAVLPGTSATDLQLPTQYLFRRCAGDGSGRLCPEPVIAWSPDARCALHASCPSLCSSRLTAWCHVDTCSHSATTLLPVGPSDTVTTDRDMPSDPVSTHLSIMRSLHTCTPSKHNSDPG